MVRRSPGWLIRLLAIASVLVGAPGPGVKAPHALRVGTDTVVLIAAAEGRGRPGARTSRLHRLTNQALPPTSTDARACGGPVAVVSIVARVVATGGWPQAHDAGGVLALKRSRLL